MDCQLSHSQEGCYRTALNVSSVRQNTHQNVTTIWRQNNSEMLQQDLHAAHIPQLQQGESLALSELSAPDFFFRPMVRPTGISGELGPRKALWFFTLVTDRFSLLVLPWLAIAGRVTGSLSIRTASWGPAHFRPSLHLEIYDYVSCREQSTLIKKILPPHFASD